MRVMCPDNLANNIESKFRIVEQFMEDSLKAAKFNAHNEAENILAFQYGVVDGFTCVMGLPDEEIRDVCFLKMLREGSGANAVRFFEITEKHLETSEGSTFYREGFHAFRFAVAGKSEYSSRLSELFSRTNKSAVHNSFAQAFSSGHNVVISVFRGIPQDQLKLKFIEAFLFVWGAIDMFRRLHSFNDDESLPMLYSYLRIYELMDDNEAKSLIDLLVKNYRSKIKFFEEGKSCAVDLYQKKDNLSSYRFLRLLP